MRKLPLLPEDKPNTAQLDSIYQVLQEINQKLEAELAAKQTALTNKETEVLEFKQLIAEKEHTISNLTQELQEVHHNVAGNRQMIEKLINDMARAQQDIEWYKRTYETRSLLGTLKEKIFGRRG